MPNWNLKFSNSALVRIKATSAGNRDRDLDQIDAGEAAFVFEFLFSDPMNRRRRYDPSTFAFYRAHGEGDLMKMFELDRTNYEHLIFEGGHSLVFEKPTADVRDIVDSPEGIAAVSERTMALGAATSDDDRRDAWNNCVRALRAVSVDAAVGAVLTLREVGAL